MTAILRPPNKLGWQTEDATSSTVDHTGLINLNSTNYTHLTAANHTDLTDGGGTTLHTHSHTNLSDIGTLSHATIDGYLNQSVKTTAAPYFASMAIKDKSGNNAGYMTEYYYTFLNLAFGATHHLIITPTSGGIQYFELTGAYYGNSGTAGGAFKIILGGYASICHCLHFSRKCSGSVIIGDLVRSSSGINPWSLSFQNTDATRNGFLMVTVRAGGWVSGGGAAPCTLSISSSGYSGTSYDGNYMDHIRESTAAHGVEIDGVTLKDGGSTILTGGTNTFNLTNGTASLDVAAGAAMDINYDLTVSGDSTINQSVATTASPTFASATITDKKNSLARVYLGTNQTGLVDATATKILFDTETFDVGGNFASYKYTCPVAGYYLVTWRVNLQSPGGILLVGAHTSLYKNGAVAGSGSGPGFGTNTCSRFRSVGSTIVYCAASDYLEIYATIDTSDSSTGTVDAGETNSYAMFYLLSTG